MWGISSSAVPRYLFARDTMIRSSKGERATRYSGNNVCISSESDTAG
jgi:hypothetical protein